MATMTAPPPQQQRSIPINTIKIVSIYPMKTTVKQLACEKGFEKFFIPPAPRGSFEIIEISDTYQWIRDLRQMGEGGRSTPGMEAVFTPAHARAESLIVEWTNNTLAAFGKPGIGIVPYGVEVPGIGQSPNDPGFEQFKALLNQLTETQTLCFQSLITDGNDRYHKGDAKNIQDIHRKAAEWMYGDAAKSLPWFRKDTFNEMKKCIGCAQEIKKEALRCQHCSLDIVDYYMKYDMDSSGDPVVDAQIKRIKANKPMTADTVLAALSKPEFNEPRAPRTNLLNDKGEPIQANFSKTEKDWALKMSTKNGKPYMHYLKELATNELAGATIDLTKED